MIGLRPLVVYGGPNPFAVDPVLLVEVAVKQEDQQNLLEAMANLQVSSADWYRASPSDLNQPPAQQLGWFLADWSLQALNFVRGYLHASGCATEPLKGHVLIWLGFHDPQLSLSALGLAAKWLGALAQAQTGSDLKAELDQLWLGCRNRHPDYQAQIVMQAARFSGVPYAPAWDMARHWRYGQGARSRVLFESSSCADGHFGARISGSKAMTKTVLQSLGLRTPAFRLVSNEYELDAAVAELGFPCVTKPIDSGGGKGVSAGLRDMGAVRQGFASARAYSAGPILVETHAPGEDHRLLVVEGRLVAAIRREPPCVTGDGEQTIGALVAAKNQGRDARSLWRSGFMRPILLDASALVHLAGLGLSAASVLAEGETVRVRSNANLSTGGDCMDVTEQVHPHIRVQVESLAKTLNMPMLGADYLTTDIGSSPLSVGGQFIEINTTPGLDALVAAGWSLERAGALALGELPGRIPINLLVLPDDALAQALVTARGVPWPQGSGWASLEQASLAGVDLLINTKKPWAGVQVLLGHRSLTQAVVIASESQIRRHGLPLEAFQVAHVFCDLPPVWMGVLRRHCNTLQVRTMAPDNSVLVNALKAPDSAALSTYLHRNPEGRQL
jgi:cyanophycin synthetase